jgi:hypothetical protein
MRCSPVLALVLFLLATVTGGQAAAGDPPPAPRLGFPVACTVGESCAIIKYVDHQPGPGIRDYGCGTMTGGEDEYPGTSIAIADMAEMRRGVAVRASADGRVVRIREGVADTGVYGPESRDELSARGCGNAVVLDHGGGWTTAYCHLRRDSVRVKPGQTVARGETVAEIGLSGLTELPHLHFQVRHNNGVVDPFTGIDGDPSGRPAEACGPGAHPLWAPEVMAALPPYRPTLVRMAGLSAGETTARAVREDSRTDPVTACAPVWRLWAEIIGIHADDRARLTVTAPDGRRLMDQTSVVSRAPAAQIFIQAPLARPGASWPAGTYRAGVTLERGGASFTRALTVTITPPPC